MTQAMAIAVMEASRARIPGCVWVNFIEQPGFAMAIGCGALDV